MTDRTTPQEASRAAFEAPTRTDLEWLRLPEIKAKFVDYALKPVDANALRIIRACAERNADVSAATQHLEADVSRLREALEFYANQSHFTKHADVWDTVSGEPPNFYEDENHTATVEDGSIARLALKETQK